MDWRRFQELVARIEKLLAPSGAVVTSPDRLPDLLTGQMREVDASVRMTVGSAEVLITFECRRRSGKEDVTWIEQLATKKQSIGAAMTMAVSSTGFSAPAKKVARLKGIELRQLQDITDEQTTQRFLSGFSLSVTVTTFDVQWCSFIGSDGKTILTDDLPESLFEALEARGLDAPLLHTLPDNQPITLNQLLAQVPKPDIPDGGEPVVKRCTAAFSAGSVAVTTREGEQELSGIQLSVRYSREKRPVSPLSLHQYTDPSGPIIEVVQGDVALDDGAGIQLDVYLNRGESSPQDEQDRGPREYS